MKTVDTARTGTPQAATGENWEKYNKDMCELADTQEAIDLAERFNVPKVAEAEAAFKKAIAGITDPEVMFAVDDAAGRIAYAYQMLGFCAGSFSQTCSAAS